MKGDLRQQLLGLVGKYEALVRMRQQRQDLEARGILRFEGEALLQRRTRGRLLAERFPGALRELDSLDVEVLAERLSDVRSELMELSRAPERREPRRQWISVVGDFHRIIRARLAKKRDRGDSSGDPGTSMMDAVWSELSELHDMTPPELKKTIFGTS